MISLKNKNHHLNEILKGSFFSFLLKITGMLSSYILILLVSKQFGTEGVGLFNLTLNSVSLLSFIGALGINVAMLRFVGQYNKEGEQYKITYLYRDVLQITLPMATLTSLALYFLSDYISEIVFKNTMYSSSLKIVAIVIPFFVVQLINIELFRGLKRIKRSEFFRHAYLPTFNIIIILLVGAFTNNILLPIYAFGLAVILGSLYNYISILKNNRKYHLPINSSKIPKSRIIKTSIPMMLTHLSSFLINTSSLFMLEIYSTTQNVGIYSVAYKLAITVSIALIVVNSISAPKISELYRNKDTSSLISVLNYSTKLAFYSSLGISLFLFIFATPILNIFGEEFTAGKEALNILIVGQVIASSSGISLIFLNMTGNEKILRNIIITVVIILLTLNYILIPIYGIMGAAISSTVAVVLLHITSAYYAKTKAGYFTFYTPAFLRKN